MRKIWKTATMLVCALCLGLATFAIGACGGGGDGGEGGDDGYTVTYDGNGGTVSKPKETVKEGELITDPATATRAHYTFDGWYHDSAKWNFDTDTVEGDMTLTAHWEAIIYTVVFIDFDDKEIVRTYTEETIGDFTMPPVPEAPAMHTNARWDKTKEQILVYSEEPVYVNAISDYSGLTVKFDTDGGTPAKFDNQELLSGSKVTDPGEVTKQYYDFKGWFCVEDGETQAWDFEKNTVTKSITLKAHWKAHEYTIKFVGFDGETEVETITYTILNYEDIVWPSVPTNVPTGHENPYWDITEETCEFFSAQEIVVTAKALIKGYDVTFDADNGTQNTKERVEYNKHATRPADPEKEHYTFAGWYHNDKLWNFEEDAVEGDITLTAHWTAIEYVVEFYGYNDAKLGTKKYTVENKDAFNFDGIEEPTADHYDFKGWDKEPAECITYSKDEPVAVHAVFTPKKYEVRFLNVVDDHAKDDIEYNTPVEYEPEREGFVFNGWHVDTLDGAAYTDAPVEGEMTLVASWKAIMGAGEKYTMSAEELLAAMDFDKGYISSKAADATETFYDSDYMVAFTVTDRFETWIQFNPTVDGGAGTSTVPVDRAITLPVMDYTSLKKVEFCYTVNATCQTLTLAGESIPVGKKHVIIVAQYDGVYAVVRALNGERLAHNSIKLPDEVANGEKGLTLVASVTGYTYLNITELRITPNNEVDYMKDIAQIASQLPESGAFQNNSAEYHVVEKYLTCESSMTEYEKASYTRNAKITSWLSGNAGKDFELTTTIRGDIRTVDGGFQNWVPQHEVNGLTHYSFTLPAINYTMLASGGDKIALQFLMITGNSHLTEAAGGLTFWAYGETLREASVSGNWYYIKIIAEADGVYVSIQDTATWTGGSVKLPDAVATGREGLEFTLLLQNTSSDTVRVVSTSQTDTITGKLKAGL